MRGGVFLSACRELKGKVLVLDFWTYCCINCMHVLPELAALERKYAGQPVCGVGVHSAKFDNEKVSSGQVCAVSSPLRRHAPSKRRGALVCWVTCCLTMQPLLAQ